VDESLMEFVLPSIRRPVTPRISDELELGKP